MSIFYSHDDSLFKLTIERSAHRRKKFGEKITCHTGEIRGPG
ncbi:hypothetical protein HMPREF0880_00179 [Yokenella regensburgei ATCC 43003]|nr:hypothetical protein HMPREF0880_00179 [Yokenella regensburgei ATCC 43003]